MKLSFKIVLLLFFMSFISMNAQDKAEQKEIVYPDLKPKFIVGDIYFALQTLEGIDIKGAEVKAFLEVKNEVKMYLDRARAKELKVEEILQVTIPFKLAQNMLSFLSRAQIKGRMADQYDRFTGAIIDAAAEMKK